MKWAPKGADHGEVHVDYNTLLPRGYVFGRICWKARADTRRSGVFATRILKDGQTNRLNGCDQRRRISAASESHRGRKTNLASLDYLNYALTQYRWWRKW